MWGTVLYPKGRCFLHRTSVFSWPWYRRYVFWYYICICCYPSGRETVPQDGFWVRSPLGNIFSKITLMKQCSQIQGESMIYWTLFRQLYHTIIYVSMIFIFYWANTGFHYPSEQGWLDFTFLWIVGSGPRLWCHEGSLTNKVWEIRLI